MNRNLLATPQTDLMCLSHLRWNFVFQRPQHLMSRFAQERRVFFVEEPVIDGSGPCIVTSTCSQTGVHIVTPHLPNHVDMNESVKRLLGDWARLWGVASPIEWFYTPMALEWLPDEISPTAVVYDCMDELSMFNNAPTSLHALEDRLLTIADVVFTGGVSLFEAKRRRHPHVHPFPSGVDVGHFAKARKASEDFDEQREMPRPRLGFAGVIDERMDLSLLDEIASKRPNWQLVMVGPTVKIDPATLPRRSNIHWLGMRSYSDLPNYFGGWDVGIMPFALNNATRFISPTKTPEYLAAGLPVVSTPIRDVVRPYGELGLARIAHSPDEFIHAAECAMSMDMCFKWRERADEFLKSLSWDSVWTGMNRHITQILPSQNSPTIKLKPFNISRARAAHV